MEEAHPLRGVRVTSLEQSVAGPLCSRILADLGATVVKVERPGSGDFARHWDTSASGISSYFAWLNRNKQSISLNLKDERGKAVMRRLIDKSDVLIQNLGPGAVDRLGLDPTTATRRKPDLIYCSITGYGRTGPFSESKAYDLLIQGESGLVTLNGYEDRPAKFGVSICDISSGTNAAVGILAALYRRKATGEGATLDISMLDSAMDLAGQAFTYFMHTGKRPMRAGMRHHLVVPYGPFVASDGVSVNIAVENRDEWVRFCSKVLRREDLINDELFSTNERRLRNRKALERLIEEAIETKKSEEWIELLKEADIPHGRVNELREALAHPQATYRRVVREVATEKGDVKGIVSPIRFDHLEPILNPIPPLGGDTEEILAGLGYSQEEVVTLRQAGAI